MTYNFNVLPSESDTDADLDLSVVEATFDLFFESACSKQNTINI